MEECNLILLTRTQAHMAVRPLRCTIRSLKTENLNLNRPVASRCEASLRRWSPRSQGSERVLSVARLLVSLLVRFPPTRRPITVRERGRGRAFVCKMCCFLCWSNLLKIEIFTHSPRHHRSPTKPLPRVVWSGEFRSFVNLPAWGGGT